MLNVPDLNRLKVFYVVYLNRSLVRAAIELHITRSAVSQALKALEEELQTKLFIRDSKKVLPTEPADVLFRSIEPLLTDLQATIQQIETGRKEPRGHLRIGAPLDFGSTHLTAVIAEFHGEYPSITFELFLNTPVSLLEMLSAGQLDLAFVDNGDIHARNYPVSILTVKKEKFIAVCSRAYFQKRIGKSGLRFDGLKELEFVDYLKHAPVVKIWIEHHFGKSAPKLNVIFSAESVRAVIAAIRGDLGIGIVPEHLVTEELKSGRLLLAAKGRDLINQISLARRLEAPVTAREKAFTEFYKRRVGLR
jgi:DNA-binding transcriptional LysR family regulator